jgi:CPA2 family monovalent cation:H+ antiporter-2
VPVLVRTLDDSALDELQAAGATVVVPEAIEGSLMLASQALALVGVPMRRVIRLVQDQRQARYGLMRDYFHGGDDDSVDEMELQRLQSVTLGANSACVGHSLGQSLAAEEMRVAVVSVRRAHGAVIHQPDPALILEAGDTLVLSGRPQNLARAEGVLLKG